MAAFVGDLDPVKAFVERGTEVDTKDEAGWTPLFWAACAGQQELAQFLIDKNADINANDGSGRSLLHQAAQAQTDAVKLVALLVAKGADINAKDNSRENTPLHLACYSGNKEVADLLIGKGADIDAKDKNGHTPLHCAALANHKGMVELLVSKGADVNAQNNIVFTRYTPLHHAAMVDADMVEFLIDNGADIDASAGAFGRTPLHQAVITGKPRIVELLIDKGADINASDRMPGITPLAWAVQESHPEIVELLITKRADVNAEDKAGRTPLDMAEEKGDTRIVEILQKHGAKKGSPTLVQAVNSGNIEQVKLLISKGADVNATTTTGMSLVHSAVMKGDKELVKVLIDNGADINTKSNTPDTTPLIAAINRGHADIAKLLIAKGADINAKGRGDYSPLHRAVMNRAQIAGSTDLMELLIEKGADIEARQEHGATPLACAAYDGNTESAKFLIEHGADIEAKLNDGETTPLLRAAREGHLETARLLLAKGANINATWRGLAPVHLAMMGDRFANKRPDKDIVKLLIEYGRDFPEINLAAFVGDLQKVNDCIARGNNINNNDAAAFTSLHCAVCGDHIEIAKLLLSKGANVNAASINNWTPLGFTWSAEMAALLIANGADVAIADNRGQTALHWAVNRDNHRGDKQLVELLLKSGANPNAKAASTSVDWEGWTPFHVACRNGNSEIVALLLAHSPDVNTKTDKGETPLSLAQAQNHSAVVELLKKQGAKE